MGLLAALVPLALTMDFDQMGGFFYGEFYGVMDHYSQVIGRYFDVNSDVDFYRMQAIGVDAIVNLYGMLLAGIKYPNISP
ncbi:hypothetical protein NL676_020498 [Syzygium grande]|nr:hypothetical protein NL676_020498 [Syzygium grande]